MTKNKGFTLAEILIALVVIGVVAALTVGYIITEVKKAQLETQIHAFYSKMNQALRRSYVDTGVSAELPRKDYTYKENVDWLQHNLLPYIVYTKVENCNDPNRYRRNAACVYLNNGELFEFVVDYNGADFLYFPKGKWFDIESGKRATTHVFAFQFVKRLKSGSDEVIKSEQSIEPYTYKWNGNETDLYNNSEYGCKKGKKRFYCAKLIQVHNWKIPRDYPM